MLKKIIYSVFVFTLLIISACSPTPTPTPQISNLPTETQAAVAPTNTPEPVALKLGVLSYMSNSPIFIAAEEGYFAEQGLDVELVNFGFSDRDMLPALLQGQLDVGLMSMSAGVLNAIEDGGNIKMVADKGFINPNACAADGFLASKTLLESGGLSEPADLKGKNVVAFTGNSFEYAHDLLLAKAGLTNEEMQILVVRDALSRNEGLGSGSIDVTTHSEPWITRAEKSGVGELWIPFSDLMPNASNSAVVFGPSVLTMDSDIGTRFLAAYLKGVKQFTDGKSDRNIEIISKYTQLPPDELKDVCWNSYQPDGKINLESLTAFIEWAVSKGYIDAPLKVDQVWDPSYVERASQLLGR